MKNLVNIFATFTLFVCSLTSYGQDRPTMERFFSISPTSAQFGPEGGVKTFSVSSSSSWEISSYPKSFGQLTRNGNTLTLLVDPNTEPSPRSIFFEVVSNEKKIRVSISQAEGISLSVSDEDLSFSASGGTQTITVSSNKSWNIDTSTASWGHLSRNGNQITVKVDKNSSNSSRNDWFSVKAGDIVKHINISQAGEQATTLSVSSSELTFSSSGGTQTITVSSNKSWNIDTSTASWGHLSRNGSQITIKVDKNSGNSSRNDWFSVKAGDIVKRINISQAGEQATTLSVSSSELTFSSSGGTQTITVSSNKSWNIDTSTASWGHLSRNGNQITVKVDKNSSNSSRNDWFSVKAGDTEKRINISQAGEEGTSLYLSETDLKFSSNEGTQTITVTSNKTWNIGTKSASWALLSKNGNQLTVKVDKNPSHYTRDSYFTVRANNKEKSINITQYGKPRRRFNHAKDNYWGGFSMGYIRKQWTQKTDDETVKYGLFDNSKYLTGIQAGLRIDPQFGAGFGMNTGIFYEYCWDKSDEDYDEYGSYHYTYEEHGLYAPLHLKFNMNFSEAFQLSFYGGAGFNYVFTGKLYLRDEGITYNSENVFEEEDGWEPFNLMLEYGASIRISAFQFDFSISKGLTNWSEDETYKETQGRPFNVSMTICF